MNYYTGKTLPGKPYPLGATYDGSGVNFAIFSEHAAAVKLCLFKEPDDPDFVSVNLTEVTGFVWHIYIPGLEPGQLYAYRIMGRYKPAEGYCFNPHKLLLDPYARAITGRIEINGFMLPYNIEEKEKKKYYRKNIKSNHPGIQKCVVIDQSFDWEGDKKPATSMHNSIIYELHVKGFTAQHSEIPPKERGTYKALSNPAIINYFKNLGITAIELMPIHHFIHDKFLIENGLSNYWGYNTIGFFAPHSEYSASGSYGEQVNEFKEMVKAYHKAGIEVILDVVYNHTGEGNMYGPSICFRGIDALNYYRFDKNNPKLYIDYTGTGNTLNMLSAQTLRMVMDSLRYWATEMHVDGFRFDLASALARGLYDVGRLSAFLDTIHQDPIISQLKLIAEPWDLGEGGYQVGNFPVLWAEWNGKYRDCVRKFWRGDESQVKELAYRLSGSSDLYEDDGRLPSSSINFITCHDGFTLHDLVSYNQKYNLANGENNRDGENNNISWNSGVEGETKDKKIIALREKRKRAFMATLMLSQGVPMISHGDEYGRTQNGNNNAYCQDNPLAWFSWDWNETHKKLYEFTKELIAIRKSQPVLHKRRYFKGRKIYGKEIRDVRWLNTEGNDMSEKEWNADFIRCMGMLLNGELMNEVNENGDTIQDDILLVLVNSYWDKITFKLPNRDLFKAWNILVDTDKEGIKNRNQVISKKYTISARSLILLKNLND
ncbi:MAG: glycogen debranching protein GlgX [Bacteroidales bacterium]|nr:glycogen debranching protein GlgX [Bacteroidales bacterium]